MRPRLRRIFIETTRACNLRCLHCAINTPGYRPESLRYEGFERLTGVLRGHRPVVHLSGHGETLLNKDFPRMLAAAVGAGSRVVFQTNAVLMDGAVASMLMGYAGRRGLTQVTVSLDAATPDLFARIRRGADLAAVTSNVRGLVAMREARGLRYPRLTIEAVAMRDNLHELSAIARLARGLGAEGLVIADLKEYPLVEGQGVGRDPERARRYLAETLAEAGRGLAIHLAPSLGALIGGGPGDDRGRAGRRAPFCAEPFASAFVQANGDVWPCCWICRPVGNIYERGFEDIWSGAGYEAVREGLKSGGEDLPPECAGCTQPAGAPGLLRGAWEAIMRATGSI